MADDLSGNLDYEFQLSDEKEGPVLTLVDKAAKRKRRREELKQKKRQKHQEDAQDARNVAILTPDLQADYVGTRIRNYYSNISTLELQDRYIPQKVFVDTTSFQNERTCNTFPAFLYETTSKTCIEKVGENLGAPHTIVMAAAAMRVADLTRVIRKLNPHVSKLFAKHIKIEHQIKTLKTQKVGIAVGTPGRLVALIEQDALAVSDIEHVVIDFTHLDAKQRNIFDIPECGKDLLDLMYKLNPYYSKVKVILF